MTGPDLVCADRRRRHKLRTTPRDGGRWNGIDDIEVSDDQRTLRVTFLQKAPDAVAEHNVRIDGGRRVRGIRVEHVRLCRLDDPALDDCMEVTVDRPGDFSTYTLRLVEPDPAWPRRPGSEPLRGFDPRYASLDFSFKVNCPSDLDCAPDDACPAPIPAEPDISYLAKDYASFRRLILDRLSLVMPAWRERHVPDLGITLVELLAYVGDQISYHQDAVATEAYLDTARLRTSVRRHARLVDYRMHDGCNARAWVCVEVSEPATLPAGGYAFVTRSDPPDPRRGPALFRDDLRGLPAGTHEVFEPLVAADVPLDPARNELRLWAWGDAECCLPAGATSATMVDPTPGRKLLVPGDVLVFEEVAGPRTGAAADADPAHRQVVRLVRVEAGEDALYDQPILEVGWAAEDALRFPLCLSAVSATGATIDPVSVARGNLVLVDHGRSPAADEPPERLEVPERAGGPPFAPLLRGGPVTLRTPFPADALVARYQADHVAGIAGRALARVRDLLRRTREGHALSAGELAELRTIFGTKALRDAGLPQPGPSAPPPTPEAQAKALVRLLAAERALLARKARRLDGLARRARAGYVLGGDVANEIEETWGPAYADGLGRASPVLAGPAAGALRQDPREALAAVRVCEAPPAGGSADPPPCWTVKPDLLASGGRDRHVVAEVDGQGRARLRFGGGDAGLAPDPGTVLEARVRVGNGAAGNVGAEAIAHVVFDTTPPAGIAKVYNPLPAEGGTDPEPLAEVRLVAPAAFRRGGRRAITADDYAALVTGFPGVQRAAATLSWTGSWYEVQVAVDAVGGGDPDERLLDAVREALHRSRRVGHDLAVVPARQVPLDLRLRVCVPSRHLRGQVARALLDVFGTRALPDGTRGLFHPDRWTFGDDVYASRLVAAARAVPGVADVEVRRLRRLGGDPTGPDVPEDGVLRIGPLEIARLDNDRGNPEHGVLGFEW